MKAPSPSSECDKFQILQFVTDRLDLEQTRALMEHLDGCQDCASFLQTASVLRAHRKTLRESLEGAQESGHLRRWPWLPRFRIAWAMAAMVLLAVVAGFWVWQYRQRTQLQLASLAVREKYPYVGSTSRGTDPQEADYLEAMQKYSRDDFRGAEALLQEHLSRHPAHPDAQFYLGVAQYRLGKLGLARDRFLKAIELAQGTDSEKYHWYLAHTYLRLGKAQEARQQLRLMKEAGGVYASMADMLLEKLNSLD
ncbi:MAG: tetratricopeptide repeat protein [Acidobacteria bacterium]|nr:tetratricopeptide repeat protein [Acidobacteriota bacterium]